MAKCKSTSSEDIPISIFQFGC